MEQAKDQIAAAGLRLVVVGIGEPKHAERYCAGRLGGAECLSNPTNATHDAFGMQRANLAQLAGPGMWISAARAAGEGHRQGESTGDTSMLAGTFVVDASGRIAYAHYDGFPGDHADLDEVLRVWAAAQPA